MGFKVLMPDFECSDEIREIDRVKNGLLVPVSTVKLLEADKT